MIVAGIDEAGLGPVLGPLTTASCAWPWPDGADIPDPAAPWNILETVVARRHRRGENRPVVGDSKQVHAAGGLAALERTVTAFADLSAGLLHPAAGASQSSLTPYIDPEQLPPWQEGMDWRLPFPGRDAAAELRRVWTAAGWGAPRLHVRVLHPAGLNRRLAAGANKHEIILGETGAHLKRLAEIYPGESIHVQVDKQGGRNRYAACLNEWFAGAGWVETLAEGAAASVYQMALPPPADGGTGPPTLPPRLRVVFAAKADASSFCVALASEIAKYVRERHMELLNRWFAARLPGLKPTAGYPLDAKRFLAELAPIRDESWDWSLVRNR